MGQKATVCRDTCDAWHEHCRDDYFEYHSLSKELIPCSDSSLVCSRLTELALDGPDMCRKAGLRVSDGGSGSKCFDGSVPALLDACQAKPRPKPGIWEALSSEQGAWMAKADALLARPHPVVVKLVFFAVCLGMLLIFRGIFAGVRRIERARGERRQQPSGLQSAVDSTDCAKAAMPPAGIAALERQRRKHA